jgi:hypothetical protein
VSERRRADSSWRRLPWLGARACVYAHALPRHAAGQENRRCRGECGMQRGGCVCVCVSVCVCLRTHARTTHHCPVDCARLCHIYIRARPRMSHGVCRVAEGMRRAVLKHAEARARQ